MSWHVQSDAMRSYASGSIDTTQQFSVEAHLLSCAACRSTLAALADRAALERTWEGIVSETAAPALGRIERLLIRCGVTEHVARLLAATPSLRGSWLLAVGGVLALAVMVANGASNGYLFFLAVAPLLPLAGIAAAFGPGVDPTYEVGIAAPIRSFRLLLIRSVAVLSSTIAFGAPAALLLPGFDWRAAAWLLPSLALSTTSLALSTLVHPLRAAVTVAVAWLATVGAGASVARGEEAARSVFGEQMQVVVLVVAVGAWLFLAARREDFERGEHQ